LLILYHFSCIDVSFHLFTAFTLDFQNGGRPPSWIWYDDIPDHPRGPRLVFDSDVNKDKHKDQAYNDQDKDKD